MAERKRPSHRAIATLRDIVEVIAILAAGAWAIYTFVYEQRIKPAQEPPSLVLTGGLERVGERNGMIQMAYHAALRNSGQTRVYVIAEGIVAQGLRYSAQGAPATRRLLPGVTEYSRSARVVSSAPVYVLRELTLYGGSADADGFDIDPGETVPFSGIFVVRKGEFDAVTLDGSIAYTNYRGVYPTKVTRLSGGMLHFESMTKARYDNLDVTIGQASLW